MWLALKDMNRLIGIPVKTVLRVLALLQEPDLDRVFQFMRQWNMPLLFAIW